jgi:sn-glycerol 3-phosphate transport system permease protein
MIGGIPIWFGGAALLRTTEVLTSTSASTGSQAVGPMMLNSLIMALGIALGKIGISIISAYAMVFFRFPYATSFSG